MSRFILPYESVYDLNGKPLDGAKLYFYKTGTNTPKDSYSDSAFTTANANPVIADSQGTFGDIFLSGEYRVTLKDKNDVIQPNYPADTVQGDATIVVRDTKAEVAALTFTYGDAGRTVFITSANGCEFTMRYNATPGTYADNGAAYCGTEFIPSGGDGTIGLTRDYYGFVNAKWFGVTLDGTTDDTAAYTTALASFPATGGTLFIPEGTSIVSSKISVPNKVIITGVGMFSTEIKAAASFNDTAIFEPSSIDGTQQAMSITDLSVHGNKAGGALITTAAINLKGL